MTVILPKTLNKQELVNDQHRDSKAEHRAVLLVNQLPLGHDRNLKQSESYCVFMIKTASVTQQQQIAPRNDTGLVRIHSIIQGLRIQWIASDTGLFERLLFVVNTR